MPNALSLARKVNNEVFGPYVVASNTNLDMVSSANMVGKMFTVINDATSTANLIVRSSALGTITTVLPGQNVVISPLQDSPTTAAHWRVLAPGVADATTSGLYSPNTMFTNIVMPAFKVDKNTASQTYTGAGGLQQITWSEGSSTAFDQGNSFASNAFTVPAGAGGVYTFSAGVLSTPPTLQSAAIFLRKNSVGVASNRTYNANGSPRDLTTTICITLKLVPGDVIDVGYASSSGASVTIIGDIQETYFSGKRDY